MENKNVDGKFEKSISKWLLIFEEKNMEELFTNHIIKTTSEMKLSNIAAFVMMIFFFLFRCYVLIGNLCNFHQTNESILYNILMLILAFVVITSEILLFKIDRLKNYKGIFLFIGGHILILDGAFIIRNAPVIGMNSYMCSIILQCLLLYFVKKWIIALMNNLLFTTYLILSYSLRFPHSFNLEQSILFCFSATVLPNFTTIFFYDMEKRARKDFFLSFKLRMRSEKYKNILDFLPVGLMLINHFHKIKFYNKKMSSYISCVQPHNIDSNSSFRVLPSFDISGSLEHFVDKNQINLKETLENHSTLDEKIYQMTEENSKKEFEVKLKAFELSNGHRMLITVVKNQSVYRDLVKQTVIKQNQKMLLASISHEIRNPLNAIFGYLSLISKNLQKESIAIFQKISYSAKQIEFIVYGACMLLLAESQEITIEPENFEIRKAFEDVLILCQDTLESKEIELTISCISIHKIFSDYKKFCLILFHLISNALKYTKSGKIQINSMPSRDDISLVEISISDTGIGIEPEKLPHLFELYSSMEKANLYNPQGMGLGLALCKRLSSALGGSIKVESTLGKGSIFSFCIRRRETRKGAVNTLSSLRVLPMRLQNQRYENISGKSLKVLVVDDEPTNRFILQAYLKDLNCIIDEAENGEVAIHKILEQAEKSCCESYNLILMDINMPIMDGTVATQKLREMMNSEKLSYIPIIAVTAANINTNEDYEKLLAVGFDDIIQKPVSKSDFLTKIKKCVWSEELSQILIMGFSC